MRKLFSAACRAAAGARSSPVLVHVLPFADMAVLEELNDELLEFVGDLVRIPNGRTARTIRSLEGVVHSSLCEMLL